MQGCFFRLFDAELELPQTVFSNFTAPTLQILPIDGAWGVRTVRHRFILRLRCLLIDLFVRNVNCYGWRSVLMACLLVVCGAKQFRNEVRLGGWYSILFSNVLRLRRISFLTNVLVISYSSMLNYMASHVFIKRVIAWFSSFSRIIPEKSRGILSLWFISVYGGNRFFKKLRTSSRWIVYFCFASKQTYEVCILSALWPHHCMTLSCESSCCFC